MKKVFTSGLVAGAAMVVANMLIVNPLFNKLFPGFQAIYENTAIFKSMEDPFMSLFFVYPIVLGFALAWVWNKVKHEFSGNVWKDGWNFGLIYFVIFATPGFMINIASFNLPTMMIVSWAVMSLVNGLVAGWVLGKMNRV